MASYVVENTQPSIVIDRGGRPVNGFLVDIIMTEFDERRELQLTTDDPKAIHEAALLAIKKRQELEELSNEG